MEQKIQACDTNEWQTPGPVVWTSMTFVVMLLMDQSVYTNYWKKKEKERKKEKKRFDCTTIKNNKQPTTTAT